MRIIYIYTHIILIFWVICVLVPLTPETKGAQLPKHLPAERCNWNRR